MYEDSPLIPRNRAAHPVPYDPGYKTSVTRSPNLPLLSLNGMPLGVQLLGFHYQDRRLVAQASWLRDFVLA